MKRSKINEIMAAAEDLIHHYGFVLPPFANWSPDQFKANAPAAARVISGRCGWDITDYGQGRFDQMGLFCSPCAMGCCRICNAAGACAMPKSC